MTYVRVPRSTGSQEGNVDIAFALCQGLDPSRVRLSLASMIHTDLGAVLVSCTGVKQGNDISLCIPACKHVPVVS